MRSRASRRRSFSTQDPGSGEMSIAEADIIVSGGRGLKGRELLAHPRSGACDRRRVGASRATVDARWIDHRTRSARPTRRRPNLYIAAGVSGASAPGRILVEAHRRHHKDPEAPIFRLRTWRRRRSFQILPALTKVKRRKALKHTSFLPETRSRDLNPPVVRHGVERVAVRPGSSSSSEL